jgi:hypothetical protein
MENGRSVYTRLGKKRVHRLAMRKRKREEDGTEGREGNKRVHT